MAKQVRRPAPRSLAGAATEANRAGRRPCQAIQSRFLLKVLASQTGASAPSHKKRVADSTIYATGQDH
jgi:hypothetical protein